jgi:uncharacterized repeat protein (TIGR03803 family)
MDTAGNLYGTTLGGGNDGCMGQAGPGCGVVFKLTPNANGSWAEKAIHRFSGKDGSSPQYGGSLTLDGQGNLYGTTFIGGKGDCNGYGCGVAFELIPQANGSWEEKVLHYFTGNVGVNPQNSLIFDTAGNLYGTTGDWSYGFTGPGTVFKLSPNADGSWTKSTLHSFNSTDGYNPNSGLVRDPAGNLYGTTFLGGAYDGGVVYQLTPNSDGTWTENLLYSFTGGQDGSRPAASLILDAAGNLYGAAIVGGANGWGTVYKLAPNQDGSWTQSILYAFKGGNDGGYPVASLTFDGVGGLYGPTSAAGAGGCGVVFKLTPTSNGPWQENVLHSFVNKPGCNPQGSLVFDAAGNLYGPTEGDGTTTHGSVYEITP